MPVGAGAGKRFLAMTTLSRAGTRSIFNVDTQSGGLMDSKIQRWGNSLAVRIPKAFAEEAGLSEDTKVDIAVEGKTITIRPARKKYTLEELLKGITPANRHELLDWGPPVGKEIW